MQRVPVCDDSSALLLLQHSLIAVEIRGLCLQHRLCLLSLPKGARYCWPWSCMADPAEPNTGRGADLDQYSWTQTLSEVTLLVPVPPGTKGRQLDVQIAKTHLRVGLKGDLPIINVS